MSQYKHSEQLRKVVTGTINCTDEWADCLLEFCRDTQYRPYVDFNPIGNNGYSYELTFEEAVEYWNWLNVRFKKSLGMEMRDDE